MAGSIVQRVVDTTKLNDLSAGSAISVTISGVISGNSILVFGTWAFTATGTCDDGNAYTAGTQIDDTANSQSSQHFRRVNVTAGAHTITISLNANVNYRAIEALEIGGLDAAPFEAAAQQYEATPTTAADAVNSGAFTSSSASAFIIGWSMHSAGGSNPTVGTGFTSYTADTTIVSTTEYRTLTAAGATDATFKTDVNNAHMTHGIAFKISAAAAAVRQFIRTMTGVGL